MSIFFLNYKKNGVSNTFERHALCRALGNQMHVSHLEPIIRTWFGGRLSLFFFPVDTVTSSGSEMIFEESCNENQSSLTILTGICWERMQDVSVPRLFKAKELHSAIVGKDSFNISSLRDSYAGKYSVLTIRPTGEFHIWNDHAGMEPVFYFQDNTQIIITNRLRLIDLCSKTGINFRALLEIPLITFLSTDNTGINGALRLAQDHYLQFISGHLSLTRLTPHFYGLGVPRRDQWCLDYAELAEKGISEISTTLKITKRYCKTPMRIGLTGGKDSRLVLSLLLASGLEDGVQFYTNGYESQADVIVARMLAKKFRLNHVVVKPVAKPMEMTHEQVLTQMAIHSFHTDGEMTPWDIQARTISERLLVVSGFCGEFFRPFLKTYPEDENLPFDLSRVCRYVDPLNIFSPDYLHDVEAQLENTLTSFEKYGASPADFHNIYHIRCAYITWLGTATRVVSYGPASIDPLYSWYLTNLSFALSHHIRYTELSHYTVMKKCKPQLLEMPFANQVWSPKLADLGFGMGGNIKPIKGKNIPGEHSWHYLLNKDAGFRQGFSNLIEELKSSQIWQIVDRDKLVKILGGKPPSLSVNQLHSFYNLIGVLFRTESIELPIKMKIPYDSQDNSLDITPMGSGSDKDAAMLIQGWNGKYQIMNTSFLFPVHPIARDLLVKKQDTRRRSAAEKEANLIFEGYVEEISKNRVSGWAWHPKNPTAEPVVKIMQGETCLGETVCRLMRKDVLNSGKGHGKYGFCWNGKIKDPLKISVTSKENITLPLIQKLKNQLHSGS